MITLSQINQYANTHDISDNTDIFNILSQMQLEYKEQTPIRNISYTPADSHVEWTTEEILALFST